MPTIRPLPSRASRRAFTLIELLVVILVIAILIAVAAPSFLGQQNKAKDSAAKQSLTVAYKAAKAASTDRDGAYLASDFTVAQLVTALEQSEPQFGGVNTAADTSALAAQKVTVLTGAGNTEGTNIKLAYLSASSKVCTLTATRTSGPTTECNGAVAATPTPTPTPTPDPTDPVVRAAAYKTLVQGEAGLFGYWRFGESSGTTATAENGPNGDYVGATLGAQGVFGAGANTSMSVNSSRMELTDASVPVVAQYTLEAWVRPDSVASNASFFERYNQANTVSGPSFGFSSSGSLSGNTQNWFSFHGRIAGGTVVSTGQWHHMVMVYDSTSTAAATATVTLYLDGAVTGTGSVPNHTGAGTSIKIGGWGNAMSGRVDEFAIYHNRLLQPSDVLAHYNAGKPTP